MNKDLKTELVIEPPVFTESINYIKEIKPNYHMISFMGIICICYDRKNI